MNRKWTLLCGGIILGLSWIAQAQASFIFTFDEKGHAFYQLFDPNTGLYRSPVRADITTTVPDPNTRTGQALQYNLPEGVNHTDIGVAAAGEGRLQC